MHVRCIFDKILQNSCKSYEFLQFLTMALFVLDICMLFKNRIS